MFNFVVDPRLRTVLTVRMVEKGGGKKKGKRETITIRRVRSANRKMSDNEHDDGMEGDEESVTHAHRTRSH